MLVFFFVLCSPLYTAKPDLPAPVLAIGQLSKVPVVDGCIADDEWNSMAVMDGLEHLDIQKSSRERTRAWIGYDQTNIYIAARCWMTPGNSPRSKQTQRDANVYTDDCVEIFVDPERKGSYKHFIGNSIGTQYDSAGQNSAWDGDWTYGARQTEFGWECEMAISFASFGKTMPEEGSAWGFLLGRGVWTPGMQFSQWGGCKTSWHVPANFGTIIFVGDGAQVLISDIVARGLDIALEVTAVGPSDRAEAVRVDAVLKQTFERDSRAQSQATVMIFDAPGGVVVGQIHETLNLQPGQRLPVKLPSFPESIGSYALEFSARDSSCQPLLVQRIPFDRIKPIDVLIGHLPTAGIAEITVDVTRSGKQSEISTVMCELVGGRPVWSDVAGGSGVFMFRYDEYGNLSAGDYELLVTAFNDEDETILSDTVPFKKSPPPPWLNNDLGKQETVMPPLIPIEVLGDNTIAIWDRRYVFSSIGLPEEIVAADAELLAEPARLIAEVNGKMLRFVPDRPLDIEQGDVTTRVTAHCHLTGRPHIRLDTTNTIEYDGFVWTTLKLSGSPGAVLDQLWLEIPLKAENARYHLPVFNASVSIPPEGLKAPVIPATDWSTQKATGLYWVGNEDRGLTMAAEDDRGWQLLDRNAALELVPSPGKMIWRWHFADRPLSLDDSALFQLCWQATPIKPVPDWHATRTQINVGYDWVRPINDKPGAISRLQESYNAGVRAHHYHEPWSEIMGYPGTFWYEDKLESLMAEAHRVGMNISLYSHPVISSIAPEFEEWSHEFALSVPIAAAFQRTPPQSIYFTCKGSTWSDFYVWNWVRMAREHGVNGIYLDGTFSTSLCSNPYHEHVYRTDDGTIRPTNCIRAARSFAKRMVCALRQEDPTFFFFGHAYDPFITRFLDYSFTGERLWTAPPDFELPLDYMRVVFSRQWGVPMAFYPGPIITQPYVQPIALLHDIGITVGSGAEFSIWAAPVYRVWEKFGVDQAEFVGYWKESPFIVSSNPDVKVSYYVKPDNVLMAAGTAKRASSQSEIKVDLRGVGLNPEKLRVATDRGEAIDVRPDSNGILHLRFPDQTSKGLYLWLSSSK